MSALLHIRGKTAADESIVAELRASGFEVRSSEQAEPHKEPFEVALISPDVDSPLQIARGLRTERPDAHIVFLTRPHNDEVLRRELLLARLGSEWSIAPAESPGAAADVIRQAVAVTERRKKLRTTLGRMNTRLSEVTAAPRRALLSDSFLASVLEQLSDVIVVLDRSGGVLAFNDAAARAFRSIQRGASFLETLPAEASEAVRAAAESRDGEAQALIGIPDLGVEYSLRATSLRDDNGDVMGMAVVARDITAARLTERRQELITSSVSSLASSLDGKMALQRLADLLVRDFADMAIADITEGGEIRRYAVAARSAAHVELLERARAFSPAGRKWHPSLAAIDRGETVVENAVDDEMLRKIAANEEHAEILRGLAPRAFVTAPLRAGDRTIGALLLARSIGEFSEEEVRTIQEIARQATTALQNIWSYQAVAEANRMKDEFLATVSHELRTPMTSILGWAQMLRIEETDPATIREGLLSIERSARAQAQLIDDLLDLSRMQMGKMQFRTRTFSLSEVVLAAAETIRPAAFARHVDVVLDIDAQPAIAGDPDRMQQVIWNLLSNAIKFSEKGRQVRVAVRCEHSTALVVVSDEGRGIAADFLPHVFERFRQADATTTRKYGGLGLGLAIVKQLVEMHGGTIRADSDGVGKGATFTVSLPVATVRVAASENDDAPTQLVDLKGTSVLVVEDEPSAAALLTAVLERAGAKARTVDSVAGALDSLRHEVPDVLLSDIAMPDEDGLALIRAIRNTLHIPEERLPAIALTAFADTKLRVTVLGAGFQAFMTKPVEPEKLTAAVAAMKKRKKP